MAEGKQEALAALEMAIRMEIEGDQFYTKAASQVTWPEGKKTLLDLARDEQGHIRILMEEHASLLAGNDWLNADQVTLRLGEGRPLPVFEKDEAVIAGMVDDRADALEVLDMAIKNEYRSHTFYAEQAAGAANPESRAVFQWLVKEEKGHQALLTNYARYLGAHEQWLFDHDRPILEG